MKIVFYGIGGAMGKVFRSVCENRNDIEIVSGVEKFSDVSDCPFPVYKSANDIKEKADCLIDFSHHTSINDYLPYAIKNNLPCVIASTGFSQEELSTIDAASKYIPILKSGNMSLGVNTVLQLAKMCAKTIGDKSDIEIVEQHHNRKIDAPSGTALLLADGIKSVLPSSTYVLGRNGNQKRQSGEIGISAVRGGTIVGKHEVMFIMDNEVITIKHEAESRSVFALGSIDAAFFIINKISGLFTMEDLFNQ